jgi:putative ABC transport system permease protein
MSTRSPSSVLRRLRVRLLPMPGQALGLAVLVAVLAAALVSAPLMIASAEQGAWEQERERLSEFNLGTSLNSSTLAARQVSSTGRITRAADLDAAITESAAEVGQPDPVAFGVFRDPVLAATPTGPTETLMTFRDGAEEHVEIAAGAASDDGVLIPEALAASAGVAPGGVLTLLPERGAPVRLPVSGVYVTPTAPVDPYWEGYNFLFVPVPDPETGDLVYPPPAVIASSDVAFATASATFEDVFLNWFLPLEPGIHVDEARAAAGEVEALQAVMARPESPVSELVVSEGYERPAPRTVLPDALVNVATTVDLLSPPVLAVGVGGGAAALVLVGAWAGLRMRRRDDEVRSLVARGLSPARGAWDAVRESFLPVLFGLATGGVVGWLLVREFGPSPDLGTGVLPQSLAVLAAGGAAALALIGAVTAALVTRLDAIGRGQAVSVLGRVPWLAVTAAITVAVAIPLLTGDPDPDGGGVGVLTLVVPLLVTVVVAGAITAVLPRVGRRSDARLRRLPPGAFLAVRRVLAGQGAARLVVVTTALSLGLVVYAGALASSTERTVEAKASVATGSDVVLPLPRGSVASGALPDGAMEVGSERGAELVPGGSTVHVLAVHPEEVAGVVRWNDALAERPLDELMSALTQYEGDRVPVILAGPADDAVVEATGGELTVDFEYYTLPVQVVGRADAFPGQGSRDPMLVADWDRYGAALEAANRDPGLVLARQVWARGEIGPVLDALGAAGYAPARQEDIRTSAEFAARPELSAQTWSLSYLRAVALAAGVLGLVGVAMHAVSQQRRRTVAALLLTRMGMRRGSSDASAGLEIGLLGFVAALVAVSVALPSSALVLRLLDPVPSLQPGALFDVPWSSIAAVVAGVALVTVAGAVLVGRTARRATGGQVLRDAT